MNKLIFNLLSPFFFLPSLFSLTYPEICLQFLWDSTPLSFGHLPLKRGEPPDKICNLFNISNSSNISGLKDTPSPHLLVPSPFSLSPFALLPSSQLYQLILNRKLHQFNCIFKFKLFEDIVFMCFYSAGAYNKLTGNFFVAQAFTQEPYNLAFSCC